MLLINYNKEGSIGGIKTLFVPHCFNEILTNIPKEVENLIFSCHSSSFNQPVDNLPENIYKIRFGFCFNQPVDNLPKKLTQLTFGYKFNKPVDNLPKNLKYLTFNNEFNQPVDNLPNNLIELTFGYSFNQSVDNLPNNLKYLTFGRQTPVRLAHPKIFIIFEMTIILINL